MERLHSEGLAKLQAASARATIERWGEGVEQLRERETWRKKSNDRPRRPPHELKPPAPGPPGVQRSSAKNI